MRLIISAFREDASATNNVKATRWLIGDLRYYDLEFVLGMYQGKREVALSVTGFIDRVDMQRIAGALCKQYEQNAVYMEYDNTAYLVDKDCHKKCLGTVLTQDAALAALADIDSYTLHLDGTLRVAGQPIPQHKEA